MSKPSNKTTTWELIGLIAALVIVCPCRSTISQSLKTLNHLSISSPDASFVGSVECQDCHKVEYDKWLGSHHDLAMDVANGRTPYSVISTMLKSPFTGGDLAFL